MTYKKKGGWGGNRLNAGRKPKGIAKAPPPEKEKLKPTGDTPMLRSAVSKEEREKSRLGFKELQSQAGVTVLDTARHVPTQIHMVRIGEQWFPEAGALLRAAKATYMPYEKTDPEASIYTGMQKYYLEYRRDELVRESINAVAYYSTARRFETQLQPTVDMSPEKAKTFCEKYKHVKDEVDKINERVNFDEILFTTIVNMMIYGGTGFEIVRGKGERIEFLLPLSEDLEPTLDKDWNLKAYKYNDDETFYNPSEVLYFANTALKGDRIGLSEIEAVMTQLEARHILLDEAMPAAATVLWAGIGVVQADTSGLSDEQATAFMNSLQDEFKPGKWVFVNQKVTAQVYDIKPDLQALVAQLEYLETCIIGNFKVPRFLLGREKNVNRSTAWADMQAFINGPVAWKQQFLSRQIERQWYDPLVREILETPKGEEPPVQLKHKWNRVSVADFPDLMRAITNAWAQGWGWLDQRKAWDLAGFDPAELPLPSEQSPAPLPPTVNTPKPPGQLPPPNPPQKTPEGRFVTRRDGEGNAYKYFWKVDKDVGSVS